MKKARCSRSEKPNKVTSVRYEVRATTSLVPYAEQKETFGCLENAIKRRKELKLLFYFVALEKVTETKETLINAVVR